MLELFVGDIDYSLSESAKQYDQNAYLIDSNNYDQLHTGVAYTSIADLPTLLAFSALLTQADKIIYAPPKSGIWSDSVRGVSKQKEWTENYLSGHLLKHDKIIQNFTIPIPDDFINITKMHERISDKQQLWISGCSVSNGYGVTTDQRYANIIASKLNMPLINLSADAASILWSGNQILMSDIKQDDIVIWGISTTSRFPYYDWENKKLNHITLENKIQQFSFDDRFLVDFTLVYLSINSILSVKNFCKNVGAKLVLAGVLASFELARYLKDTPEYIHLHNFWGHDITEVFIDTGFDGLHPGPETHQWYADQILNFLRK